MILTIILLVLLSLAVFTLFILILRKLPQLRVVDPSTSREGRTKGLKYELLRQRLARESEKRTVAIKKIASGPFTALQNLVRSTAARLQAIEKSYNDRQKSGRKTASQAEIRALLDEGHKLLDDERFDAAEKKFIEVLSIEPKNKDAYEAIGRLYLRAKDLPQAKEAFKHLLKLSRDDASVLASLGEIAVLENEIDEAYTYFSRAKNISPNNPKYLDFFIEAALAKGDVLEATMAVDHLRSVNPENQKIKHFDERIDALRKKKKETK